ncbi:PAS domain S-box protein [Methanoregula sp.]|uniref:PAS domain S-box protein n=1 Tax=Methanoregula sp. TaxID=2052170 RepID=UPI003563B518
MTKISVLYVDDEPALLELAPHYLKRSGLLSITTLDSAKKALEELKVHSFDAIVSDYQMPEMNGIEFLKKIREQSNDIPFILFTGKGREEVVIEAFNCGADAYLQKGGAPKAQFAELEQKIKINVEHRRSQLALSESEQKYRQLVENVQECIFIIQDEKFAFYNPKFYEIVTSCGFTSEEFFSRPFFTFVHPEDQPALRERYQKRIEQGEKISRYPFRIINKRGEIYWWEVNAIRIVWNGKPATLNFSRDISEAYHLRELVEESESRYRELVESLPKTVIELDKRFNVIFMNRACREKWGYTDPTNTTPFSALDLIHPDERSRIRDMYVQSLNGTVLPVHEVIAQKRNGSTFPMVVYSTQIHRNKSVEGFRLVCVDISTSKKLRDQLVQANSKLNLMFKITLNDLNNKLTALRGYLALTKEHTDDQQALSYLQKIEGITDFLQGQVQFTKTYQEIGLADPEWQPVKEVIAQSRMTHFLENITIRVDVRNVEIYADLLLEKVFYNLFHNSLCHGGHVTSISISCRKTGQTLVITYEDNGVGIPVEDKSRLFTCGFGKHTGLGLFLIREILAITGMSIAETGEPGKGARFEIYVPKGKYRLASDNLQPVGWKVTS